MKLRVDIELTPDERLRLERTIGRGLLTPEDATEWGERALRTAMNAPRACPDCGRLRKRVAFLEGEREQQERELMRLHTSDKLTDEEIERIYSFAQVDSSTPKYAQAIRQLRAERDEAQAERDGEAPAAVPARRLAISEALGIRDTSTSKQVAAIEQLREKARALDRLEAWLRTNHYGQPHVCRYLGLEWPLRDLGGAMSATVTRDGDDLNGPSLDWQGKGHTIAAAINAALDKAEEKP